MRSIVKLNLRKWKQARKLNAMARTKMNMQILRELKQTGINFIVDLFYGMAWREALKCQGGLNRCGEKL